MAEVDVPALQEGAIQVISVREGGLVTQDQLLVQLDNRRAIQATNQARIQYEIAHLKATDDSAVLYSKVALEVANASLQRALESRKRFPDTPSQAELDMIRLKVAEAQQHLVQSEQTFRLAKLTADLAQSALQTAESELDSFQSKSPFQGTVVEVIARQGEWVRLGSPVVRVVQLDRLKAEAYVTKEQSALLRMDTPIPVTLLLPSVSQQRSESKIESSVNVVFVSPEVDSNDGRLRIIMELDNTKSLMSPGMRIEMHIRSGTLK